MAPVSSVHTASDQDMLYLFWSRVDMILKYEFEGTPATGDYLCIASSIFSRISFVLILSETISDIGSNKTRTLNRIHFFEKTYLEPSR